MLENLCDAKIQLKSAQVDQIVSIYNDVRLYYKLNNFVS